MSFFVSEKNGRLAKSLVEILSRTGQNIPSELQALASFAAPKKGKVGRGGYGGRGRY